jgi:hypothetical protein
MAPTHRRQWLPLLLLFLAYSSGTKLNPLLHFPQCRSPSSITTAQQLGPAVESQDLCAQPLPNGAAKRANLWSTWLPHRLNRFGSVPEPDGLALGDGSAGGAARVSEVGEDDGKGSVRGASGPLVSPVDQWKFTSSGKSPVPQQGR